MEFYHLHKVRFASLPRVVQVKKSFALGYNRVVAANCASHGQSTPLRLTPHDAAYKLRRSLSSPLIKISSDACGPLRSPLRDQTRPFLAIVRGVTQKIVVLSKLKFVLRFTSEGIQSIARF